MSTTAMRIRQTAAEEDDAAIGDDDKVLLLELSGNGCNRDLRRFGTVHPVDLRFYI
jgi:hypothetical protein